ncbi:family 20 glycosylhydrolase [Erysipelothrix sp. HDW6B]|uniref:family 20 glycosylhydrolase n=1 Tax=Erysipelothrix sp. HDW6B TaxID=2714929 RepID=UPI00140DE135|nr:family 20 glycosylhydrolase [Erysipelothrix sp. HDW6B]QIK85245.1 family 20 glycosylhydrolase [Erysipelothrix sp. HDW6B]
MLEDKIKILYPHYREVLDVAIDPTVTGYIINGNTIRGSSDVMAFYGALDRIQGVEAIHQKPWIQERGVHIDLGRKYFSKTWFFDLIEVMAKQKLNTLQIHISENEGFRLALDGYESLCSPEHLTTFEMRDIIRYANFFYIKVIPSFDTPGHLKYILKDYPQYQLKGNETALDITNPKARRFIKGMLGSVMECFYTSQIIHIGGDEFIPFENYGDYPQLEAYAKAHISPDATGVDTYIDYINDIANYVYEYKKEVRVWNDGLYRTNQKPIVKLDKHVQVTYWTSWNQYMAPVETFIKHKHKVLNFMDQYLYFVLGEKAGYTYPTVDKIQASFEPHVFPLRHELASEQRDQVMLDTSEQYLGSFFAVWCDDPNALSQTAVLAMITPLIEAFGGKLWSD